MTIADLHKKAEKALKTAVYNLVQERKKTGEVVIVWRNGKVARVDPRTIHLKRISR